MSRFALQRPDLFRSRRFRDPEARLARAGSSACTAARLVSVALVLLALLLSARANAQAADDGGGGSVAGTLLDDAGEALAFANVVLQLAPDSSIAKVEVTGDDGAFAFVGVPAGRYFVTAKYVGLPDRATEIFELGLGERHAVGELRMQAAGVELAQATVTAQRAIVEVKSDRTVFNVEGTINSAGGDALTLLRKAPGVLLDNQDNVTVLGRTGVLIYIDGKRSPLTGDALTAYLQSLPAEQIDRIDIITNPSAKYEAEGNAGIIDIRLKKREDWGTNGSASLSASQGRRFRGNSSLTLNHREGQWNTYLTGGAFTGAGWNRNFFNTTQRGIYSREVNDGGGDWQGGNLKLGTDFFAGERHTFGVQANANYTDNYWRNESTASFRRAETPDVVYERLVASNTSTGDRYNVNGNVNYRFDDGEGQTVNVDLDYGMFRRDDVADQPNDYFAPDGVTLIRSVDNAFNRPTDIDIYTGQFDYERKLGERGRLSAGAKFTKVVTDNTFEYFDVLGGENRLNPDRSNLFAYDEQVEAGYLSYNTGFGGQSPAGRGQRWTLTTGLRVEHTNSMGDLTVFGNATPQAPVDLDYWNWFPNAGLTYVAAQKHQLALSYGRRINRPDYQVLNPFQNKLSEISFEQGNPFLRPEIVNNVELAHTFAYRYTTKLSYSRTEDQITRLVFRDPDNDQGGFITWENLATQEVTALNVSLPGQLAEWWNVYFTATGTWTRNRGNIGDTASIDLSALSYNMYAQNTFQLPGAISFEVSGWFNGPGIWGGTFETQAMGALNVGFQRKFLADKLRLRVAADDLFFTSGWRAVSVFAGQVFDGGGNWDSRRVSVSVNYNFGNDKVKARKRKTAIEDAAGRIGGGNG